jgi:hypothetical protein
VINSTLLSNYFLQFCQGILNMKKKCEFRMDLKKEWMWYFIEIASFLLSWLLSPSDNFLKFVGFFLRCIESFWHIF